MRRTAPRLARILACAAVPVMLVAGCNDSGSGSDDKKKDASASPTPSPTVAPAKFRKLPEPCGSLSGKTIEKLVPKAKSEKGKALPSSDKNDSGACLWTGLDGYQYRSLTLSFKRFDSDLSQGTGDKQAEAYASDQADKAGKADGAKDAKRGEAAIGDGATTVRTKAKKDGDEFLNQTVVARTANIVITVEYDGTGYEDAKAPSAEKLLKGAEDIAKEAVESVASANK
ncbi:hypothetical protein ACQUSR_13935 [Streptomyces sp. P1-3]|uniref:hypothetical protein n=1 Tax=Streptomyces sp. P1-3 TaxID=3421658 RepID=UPI003D368738